jgi:hypothetical protein
LWGYLSGSKTKFHYQTNNGVLTRIFWIKKLYCRENVIDGKRQYTPIQPQPNQDNILILSRYYSSLKTNPNYKHADAALMPITNLL